MRDETLSPGLVEELTPVGELINSAVITRVPIIYDKRSTAHGWLRETLDKSFQRVLPGPR